MATAESFLIRVTEGQIVVGDELRLSLSNIQESARGIVVRDNDTCESAMEVVKLGQEAIKQVKAIAEPERLRLDNAKKQLLAERDKIISAFSAVITPLELAARNYRIKENIAAKQGQEKLNKGKAYESRVEVIPDVPHVPGVRFQTRYRAECKNFEKLLAAYCCSRGERRAYLRKFITFDEAALNAEARETKDSKKLNSQIPGCHFYEC